MCVSIEDVFSLALLLDNVVVWHLIYKVISYTEIYVVRLHLPKKFIFLRIMERTDEEEIRTECLSLRALGSLFG